MQIGRLFYFIVVLFSFPDPARFSGEAPEQVQDGLPGRTWLRPPCLAS